MRDVTHPRAFEPPTELSTAVEDFESLFRSPTLSLLGEGPSHTGQLRRALLGGQAVGNLVHDAHIAALCLEHGVSELLTADPDLTRFAPLRVRNPFVASS